jgi:hypothetical protein
MYMPVHQSGWIKKVDASQLLLPLDAGGAVPVHPAHEGTVDLDPVRVQGDCGKVALEA